MCKDILDSTIRSYFPESSDTTETSITGSYKTPISNFIYHFMRLLSERLFTTLGFDSDIFILHTVLPSFRLFLPFYNVITVYYFTIFPSCIQSLYTT